MWDWLSFLSTSQAIIFISLDLNQTLCIMMHKCNKKKKKKTFVVGQSLHPDILQKTSDPRFLACRCICYNSKKKKKKKKGHIMICEQLACTEMAVKVNDLTSSQNVISFHKH